MRTKLSVAALIFFVSSCISRGKISKISASIKNFTIDNVVKLQEGCRVPKMIINIELHNNTMDTIKLYKPGSINYCNLSDNHPILLLRFNQDSIIGLTISEDYFILPNTKLDLRCIVLKSICENSLEKIKSNYLKNLDFLSLEIKSEKFIENSWIKLKRKSNFKIVFMLDDKIVNPDDSISMNSNNDPPVVYQGYVQDFLRK